MKYKTVCAETESNMNSRTRIKYIFLSRHNSQRKKNLLNEMVGIRNEFIFGLAGVSRDGNKENNVKSDFRQKVHKLKLRETLTTFMAPPKLHSKLYSNRHKSENSVCLLWGLFVSCERCTSLVTMEVIRVTNSCDLPHHNENSRFGINFHKIYFIFIRKLHVSPLCRLSRAKRLNKFPFN